MASSNMRERATIMTSMFNKKEDADVVIEVIPESVTNDATETQGCSMAKKLRTESTIDDTPKLANWAVTKFYIHSFILKTYSPCLMGLVDGMALAATQNWQPGELKIARLKEYPVNVVKVYLKLLYGFDPIWCIECEDDFEDDSDEHSDSEDSEYLEGRSRRQELRSQQRSTKRYELLKGLASIAHRYETKFVVEFATQELAQEFVDKERVFELFEIGFTFEAKALRDAVVKFLVEKVNDRFSEITTTINGQEWLALKKNNAMASCALLEQCGEKWPKGKKCPSCKIKLAGRCVQCEATVCGVDGCRSRALRVRCSFHAAKQ